VYRHLRLCHSKVKKGRREKGNFYRNFMEMETRRAENTPIELGGAVLGEFYKKNRSNEAMGQITTNHKK